MAGAPYLPPSGGGVLVQSGQMLVMEDIKMDRRGFFQKGLVGGSRGGLSGNAFQISIGRIA